ncbi:winged helix-turn-helix domain-containing protein [uncultured Photobacterium sp.]|uniref:winged helix-turn-helix domain-containing protein n=1 Tax=uncultured Photobacterium sp. TaxID=173973 RepID=UPI0026392929|nr:winged helix-turn-helix domain-containing protein [uncultured Photobacterium sp.]
MKINITSNIYLDMEMLRVVCFDDESSESFYKLSPSEANILSYLVDRNGQLVSKDELIAFGWKGRVVGNNSLNVAIHNLRKVLSVSEDIKLENIPRRGYVYSSSYIEYDNREVVSKNKERVNINVRHENLISRKTFQFIRLMILVFANLVFFRFYLMTYIDVVDVECKRNHLGIACYSKDSAIGAHVDDISKGVSVLSELNSTNKEITWSKL